MIRNFEVKTKLGEGAYSRVYRVVKKGDIKEYALKMVDIKAMVKHEADNALNEIRLLASVRHPNILCFKEAFIDKDTQNLCIIMECADAGDLQQFINNATRTGERIPEDQIWNFFLQVVSLSWTTVMVLDG
jgi:NIMA (never in mitosis gene a)-related kinase